LKKLTLAAVRRLAPDADVEVCVHLVGAPKITALNEDFLGHEGPTDVITFDLSDGAPGRLAGEIFVCVEVAEKQAREFQTQWPEEVARYVVHGFLHLMGHDDLDPASRRRMKRVENQTVRWLAQQARLARINSPKKKTA
jgi:probable rRNA maturation factor